MTKQGALSLYHNMGYNHNTIIVLRKWLEDEESFATNFDKERLNEC